MPAIMPMMTDTGLPVGRETVMIMIWIMKNVAARKDIIRHPVPMVRKVPISAPTIVIISQNVSLPVPQIM